MPLFRLNRSLAFPPPDLAEPEGLLAIGGDLSVARLRRAYASGIFPWYSDGDPLLWWSPDPRYLLFPAELKVAKSMRPLLNRPRFEVTFDRRFDEVLQACATAPRPGAEGTWITPDMAAAYHRLHVAGYAHSVEVWSHGTLAGGLYGVSLGRAFFGESMFARESNASKFGFITLVRTLQSRQFHFVDCQVHTDHLARLGARPVPRKEFLARLARALEEETLRGDWGSMLAP